MMLAIKTLTFGARLGGRGLIGSGAASGTSGAGVPGLVFDEIDAGIGGRVADVVGRKLQALGSAFQVLCITHLPQIAACADTHFAIEKRVRRNRTTVHVRRLEGEDRVTELARMLGGETVTEGLRASAREMLAERGSTPGRGESERRKRK
jgi:DNA repair protein RecN (Recombination protein N)